MRALFVAVAVALLLCVVARAWAHDESEDDIYSNSWAVEIVGGPEAAQKIAEKHGFIHVGKVRNLSNQLTVTAPLSRPSAAGPSSSPPFRAPLFSFPFYSTTALQTCRSAPGRRGTYAHHCMQ